LTLAYVALGSNLDQPRRQLQAATAALAALPHTHIVVRSHDYATPPWGMSDQPEFVNAVVALDTSLTSLELLDVLQSIERAQGRRRDGPRWGPRTLDLDLLLYDEEIRDGAGLQLPHPRLAERAFVLLPLAEIAPQLDIPGHGRVDALLARLDSHDCRRLEAMPAPPG
jgi:2-amino-4-hydroxy-6-hydroxymethyldihydropteridine diphosphokinase